MAVEAFHIPPARRFDNITRFYGGLGKKEGAGVLLVNRGSVDDAARAFRASL